MALTRSPSLRWTWISICLVESTFARVHGRERTVRHGIVAAATARATMALASASNAAASA
jgi:hypothetical protein